MMTSDTTREEALLRATTQRRRDLTFLAALLLLLVASAFAVIRSAYPPERGHQTVSGEIRAVDPAVLRRQLKSGRLSDREAEHYRGGERPAARGGMR